MSPKGTKAVEVRPKGEGIRGSGREGQWVDRGKGRVGGSGREAVRGEAFSKEMVGKAGEVELVEDVKEDKAGVE